MTCPTRPADSAPASTAAFTAATSPRTNVVTIPLPALSQPLICTFAALSIASVPSVSATSPLVSSNSSASLAINSPGRSLDQFNPRGRFKIARVSFIGINMHFENHLRMIHHAHTIERHAARAVDLESHLITIAHGDVGQTFRTHVNVALCADHTAQHGERTVRAEDRHARPAVGLAAYPQRKIDAQVYAVRV